MTETASKLVETFFSLPADEQHEVVVEILRYSGEMPSSPMSDDDLVAIADELFQSLDEEEADGNHASSR